MSGIWLRGGRAVDPNTGEDAVRDVFVAGGAIVAPPASTDGWTVIACEERWVLPGFVDLHAVIVDAARDGGAAVLGGFGAVCTRSRPAGAPCTVLRAGGVARDGLLADPLRAVAEGVVAFTDGGAPIADTRLLRNALTTLAVVRRPVLLRAADPSLDDGVVAAARSVDTGLPAWWDVSEVLGIARGSILARETGCPVHFTHVRSRAGVEAVRSWKAQGAPITASTTAHHLATDDGWIERSGYSGVARLHPPVGTDADRAALVAALHDGTLDAVASDHAPIARHRTDLEFQLAEPGFVGFADCLALVVGAIPEPVVVARALSTGPAAVLGLRRGLSVGMPAEITVVDAAAQWTLTSDLGSADNTPLRGSPLVGRAVATLVGGVAYASE